MVDRDIMIQERMEYYSVPETWLRGAVVGRVLDRGLLFYWEILV